MNFRWQIAGMPYLHETLGPVIDEVYNVKKVMELDPSRIGSLKKWEGFTAACNAIAQISLDKTDHMDSFQMFDSSNWKNMDPESSVNLRKLLLGWLGTFPDIWQEMTSFSSKNCVL